MDNLPKELINIVLLYSDIYDIFFIYSFNNKIINEIINVFEPKIVYSYIDLNEFNYAKNIVKNIRISIDYENFLTNAIGEEYIQELSIINRDNFIVSNQFNNLKSLHII